MICLYAADESLFEHNGLGILDNDLKKCHVEEVLNNLYTLTAQYPLWAKFGKSIRNGMIIKAPTPNGDQLFRIYQSKPSMGMLEIHAFHIFYDLAFNFVEDTNIVSKSGQAWLQQLSQNTQYSHPFTFFSDISTVAGSRVVRKNCVEILLNTSLDNSFVNRFGGEILRDNFNVYFNRAIGENRGFKIRHKKNLKGYTANIDDKSVITRIMPIGFDGLLLPEKYVDSPRISDYPFPRIGKVEVDVKAAVGENTDAKDAIPLNEAYTKMRALIKEQFGVIDVPTCSYEVDFVELSKTKEYADFQNLETVRIGDTVTVSHDDDGFYVEAKVIRYEYDSLAGRLLRIEAGQFESRSSNNSINQQRSIEQQLEDVKIETSNMVQVAANGKNTIYRGVDRPENANVGDLWYEPLENSIVLKQWSGVDWELIPISDQNLGNVNVNNLSGNYIDVRRFRISSGDRDILYVNEAGEVILNAKRIQMDFTDVATKTDLQEIELTPGPQGAAGVGISSTTITYASSSSGTTAPSSGWTSAVPSVPAGEFLWTKTIWNYSDFTSETGYSVAKMGEVGPPGPKGDPGEFEGKLNFVNLVRDSKINKTSNAYGFGKRSVWLEAGKTYQVVARAKRTGGTSENWGRIYLYELSWSKGGIVLGVDSTEYEVVSASIPVGWTGEYFLESYWGPNGENTTGTLSVDWYMVVESDLAPNYWSPHPEDPPALKLGGKNYFRNSNFKEGLRFWENNTASPDLNLDPQLASQIKRAGALHVNTGDRGAFAHGFFQVIDMPVFSNDQITLSFDVATFPNNDAGLLIIVNNHLFDIRKEIPASEIPKIDDFSPTSLKRKSVTLTIPHDCDRLACIIVFGSGTVGNMVFADLQIEHGFYATDYSLHPDEIIELIDSKADQALTQEQINMLAEKNALMQTELEAKLSMEKFSDLEKAYLAYVDKNNADVSKSEANLIEAFRRIGGAEEVLGGLSKTKTFIDTYIKEAEEGIIIGTNDNVSQIRVTYDRISMYSSGKEVMYISQGVIHIDNGVFTKSLQIGRFRTEQHPTNLDINVCRYLG